MHQQQTYPHTVGSGHGMYAITTFPRGYARLASEGDVLCWGALADGSTVTFGEMGMWCAGKCGDLAHASRWLAQYYDMKRHRWQRYTIYRGQFMGEGVQAYSQCSSCASVSQIFHTRPGDGSRLARPERAAQRYERF